MEVGYITRWLPNQGLPHGLRITIGSEAQMDEIAAAIARMAHGA
jgi:histidinol-phosphate aminotransferase